jgi:hypothetical protein
LGLTFSDSRDKLSDYEQTKIYRKKN